MLRRSVIRCSPQAPRLRQIALGKGRRTGAAAGPCLQGARLTAFAEFVLLVSTEDRPEEKLPSGGWGLDRRCPTPLSRLCRKNCTYEKTSNGTWVGSLARLSPQDSSSASLEPRPLVVCANEASRKPGPRTAIDGFGPNAIGTGRPAAGASDPERLGAWTIGFELNHSSSLSGKAGGMDWLSN